MGEALARKYVLPEAGLAEQQHGHELDRLVAGNRQRQVFAQVVDDGVRSWATRRTDRRRAATVDGLMM